MAFEQNPQGVREQTVQVSGRRTSQAERRARRAGLGAGSHVASKPKGQQDAGAAGVSKAESVGG